MTSMFFSPPRRKPNKKQNSNNSQKQASVKTRSKSAMENLNLASSVNRDEENSEVDNRLTETSANVRFDEPNTSAASSSRGNPSSFPSSVERNRNPTPTRELTPRTKPVNDALIENLEARLINVILAKFDELLRFQKQPAANTRELTRASEQRQFTTSGNNNISEGGVVPPNPVTDYLADDESDELHAIGEQRPGTRTNAPPQRNISNPPRAFAVYSRADTFNASGRNVNGEPRHVHFQNQDRSGLPFNNCSEPVSGRIESHSSSNNRPTIEQERLIRITVGRPLPNGQIVDEDILLTEQQYKRMKQNGESFISGIRPAIPAQSLPNIQHYGSQYVTQRSGILSGRTSDSSGEDEVDQPRGHNGSYVRENNSSTNYRSTGYSPTNTENGGNPISINIGRIIASWKIAYPKTEKDPDQFLLILKDLLNTSGIHKDRFIPFLSKIFEGPYRSWYLVNKKSWRTWKDFSRAFRYQWGVKKADGDLFVEVHGLKVEKGENLAEFACRARLIFERMQRPPVFREQLKQILTKFNPRLAFEILNLPLANYDEFLHYVTERHYLSLRSAAVQTNRSRLRQTELNYVQNDLETDERENDPELTVDDEPHDDEDFTDLKVLHSEGNLKKNTRPQNSKTLVKQRLERNLECFHKVDDRTKQAAKQTEQASNANTKPIANTNKFFCYNCGQTGHMARFCEAERQLICFKCRKIGHENKDCQRIQGNGSRLQ